MAGGSVSSSFLLVNLHGARSPMRPKNVILLEINIIATNFNYVDLLYYLLLDAFVQQRRVWCTMVAVERCWPPSLSLLAPSCLIFLRSVCVFASTWPEAIRPFFLRVENAPTAGTGTKPIGASPRSG